MIFLCRFESSRYRALRDAAHALTNVLRGFVYATGRQPFRFGLPGRFVVDFSDGVFGSVETMRCGGLGAPLDHRTGIADQAILNVGAGKRAGDQTPYQQTHSGHQQRILFNCLENGLSGAISMLTRAETRRRS